jgi:hypothetical protein
LNRYGVISKTGEGYRVTPLEGAFESTPSDGFTALMMSRLDIHVHFVSLPPVQKQEIPDLLRYKLRGIYPGPPEKTVFDYVLLGKKHDQYAALCIARKEVIDAHREIAAGKPLFHSLSLLLPFVERHAEKNRVLILYHEDCIETLVCKEGSFRSSWVTGRTNVVERDLRKLCTIISNSEADAAMVLFCTGRELKSLRQALSTEFGSRMGRITLQPFQVLTQHTLKKTDYVFSVKNKGPVVSQKILIPSLVLLCFLLAAALLHKNLAMKKTYHAELSTRVQQLERKNAQFFNLQHEIEGLEGELQTLDEKVPCNIYLLLSELSIVLGSDARVTRFLVESNMFQIEGVSPSPLLIMDRFEEREGFHGVKLSHIIPLENSGEKRFKVHGYVEAH